MKKLLLVFCFLVSRFVFAQTPPVCPSVLIIGGGPSGLATAIEARLAGYQVTVVEKRDFRERRHTLFLFEPSLELLKKWEVTIASMKVVNCGGYGVLGMLSIRDLEESLEKRALELGVKKLLGEFKEFHKGEALIATQTGNLFLAYDLIVAADGVHSRVREALEIQSTCFGEATGAAAFVPFDSPQPIDISPVIQKDDLFIRKITLKLGSLIFMQTSSPNLSLEKQWQKMLEACGWEREAQTFRAGKVSLFINQIPIVLSQASRYCDEQRKAILIGDAAATASFFQGMGANTSLKTAVLAGDFFKKRASHDPSAYQSFEQGMQETTEALIENSRFLFAL